MFKISVITPSVRSEGLKLVEKALKRQTFKDFEWIIVGNVPDTSITFPFTYLKDPEKQEGDVWVLNKAYNKAIRHAQGELIVSWQDWTYAKPDTLERFYQHFLDEPKTLVGAVGNKYQDEEWAVVTWQDPRITTEHGTYYPVYFSDIEWNLASIPKQAIYDVGGFDEYLDKWYGMDAYSVNARIHLLGGYDFKLDQTIKSYSLEHGRLTKDWEEKNAIHGPYQERSKEYIKNPTLTYLG